MKRLVILISLLVGILGSFASAQAGVPQELADARRADLISKVQNMPASKLDKKLPAIRLADWLQAQGGQDARIAWAFRSAAGTPESRNSPDCVEVVATLKNDRSFMVMIAVGKDALQPSLQSGWVIISPHETIDLERLSDLSGAMIKLNKTNANSSRTEAKNE